MHYRWIVAADIDIPQLGYTKKQLQQTYCLIIQRVSTMDRSFELALPLCVFHHEEQV